MPIFKKQLTQIFIFCFICLSIGNAWGITFDFPTLQSQVYMGGSLMFNSSDATMSHLTAGQNYPFRLGKVVKHVTNNVTINGTVYPTYTEFDDQAALAKYGVFKINSISLTSIVLTYTLYSPTGSVLFSSRSITLSVGASFDLDGDGFADVTYKTVDASTNYLTFNSSQISLATSMYSYDPTINTTLNGVGGNIGVNINGNNVSIPQLSDLGSLGKVLSSKMIIKPGDYIFDKTSWTYKKVSSTLSKMTATSATSLATVLSTATTVTGVIEPLQMVSLSAPVAALPANSYKFYTTQATYDQQRANLQAQLDQCKFKTKLFTTSLVYDGGFYKMGLTTVTGNIGISGHVSFCWGTMTVQGDLSALLLIDDVLGVTTTQKTTLASFDHPFKEIPLTIGNFMVGPIPMGWAFNLTSGVKGSIDLTTSATLGVKNCIALSGKGTADLGVFGQTFGCSGYYNLIACPMINAGTTTSASVQAYFGAELQVFVGLVPHSDDLNYNYGCPLYAELRTTIGCGPTITVPQTLTTINVKVDANFAVPFELGSDWLHYIKLPIIGQCPWHKTWTLFSYTYNFYNQTFPIVSTGGAGYWTSPDYAATSGNLSPSILPMTNLLLQRH